MQQIRAIIYVPADERERWEAVCLDYCQRHGYRVVALMLAGPGKWDSALAMCGAGEADIIVVASNTHLDPNRMPRIESVTEEVPRFTDPPRRTRIIRRDEEA
jgi:hypothetical protein